MNRILKGIAEFSKTGVENYLGSIKNIVNRGGPHSVVITCVDSRVCPTSFTKNGPGSFFMLKNAGNFVPEIDRFMMSYASLINPVPAVLDLTCERMGLRNVIVCGHSDCKALALLHSKFELNREDALTPDLNSPLDAWVCSHGKQTVEYHFKDHKSGKTIYTFNQKTHNEFRAIIDETGRYGTLDHWSQVNVLQQICHLQKYPMISKLKNGISIHALWIDITEAIVYMFDIERERYIPINENTIDQLSKSKSF